jgi:hypothetical protein
MSRHKVDIVSESTPGAGVTIEGGKFDPASLPEGVDLEGVGSPRNVVTASRGKFFKDTSDTSGRGIWHKIGATTRGWARLKDEVQLAAFDPYADNATDDKPAIEAASAAAVLAGLPLYLNQLGTYFINTSATINADVKVPKGTVLRRAAGATVTFNGTIDAGYYKWYDDSAGGPGGFVFNKQRDFKAEWPGVVGDNVADDTAAMNRLSVLPHYSKVYFDRKMDISLLASWAADSKYGVEWISRVPVFPDGIGVSLNWKGPYLGNVVSHNRLDRCKVNGFSIKPAYGAFIGIGGRMAAGSKILIEDGFGQFTQAMADEHRWVLVQAAGVAGADLVTQVDTFQNANQVTLVAAATGAVLLARWIVGVSATSGPALVGIDSDQTGGGPPCTANDYSDNLFPSLVKVPQAAVLVDQVGVRISNLSGANCEYFRLVNIVALGGAWTGLLLSPLENTHSVAINAGNPLVIATLADAFTTGVVGQWVDIVDGTSPGVSHRTKVLSRPAPDRVTLQVAPGATLAATVAIFGEGEGVGIQVGHSSNSKKHLIEDGQYQYLAKGIHQKHGSTQLKNNSFSLNTVDIEIGGASEPMTMFYNNSEASRQHIKLTGVDSTQSMKFVALRLAPAWCKPNSGYIEAAGLCAWHCDGINFDQYIRPDATFYNLINAAGSYFKFSGTRFATYPTLAQTGYDTINVDSMYLSEFDVYILGMPSIFMKHGSLTYDNFTWSIEQGRLLCHIPITAPVDANMRNNQFTPYTRNSRLAFRQKNNSGGMTTREPIIHGDIKDLVDGANVPTNAADSDAFLLTIAGTPRTMSDPTNPEEGQMITYWFWNTTGAPATVNWGAAFKMAGSIVVAAGKVITVKARYKQAWASWLQEGAASPNL